MDHLTLKIGGMTCGRCATAVERALKAISGVNSVAVSLERGEANVAYDPARVDRRRLIEAVTNAGYLTNEPMETSFSHPPRRKGCCG